MRVSAFMRPANKVYTLGPADSIGNAMDLMLQHHIGSIVILATDTSASSLPIGIITKTDILQAYQKETPADRPIKEILRADQTITSSSSSSSSSNSNSSNGMTSAPCLVVLDTMSRDQAARILDKSHNHHAIVLDSHTHNFAGLISSFDIAVECAKDSRAWPWIRSEDGRFHKPTEGDDDDDDDLFLPLSPRMDYNRRGAGAVGAGGAVAHRDEQHHGGPRRHGHAFSDTFERYLHNV